MSARRRSRSPQRKPLSQRSPRRSKFCFGDIPELSEEKLLELFVLQEEKVLGSGSFGQVVPAIQKETGTIYAVKIIPLPKYNTGLVHNELRIHSMLKHPNIVTIHYTCLGRQRAYIVMDYCQSDLETFIRQRPLSKPIVARLMIQLCNAVEHCHEKRIIHRDIKPLNILLDAELNVKLADFGFAINARDSTQIVGTPIYSAPEQILGRLYDHSVDNWAIGMVCYTCLTGAPMFRSVYPYEAVEKLSENNTWSIIKQLDQDACDFIFGLIRYSSRLRTPLKAAITYPFCRNIEQYPAGLTYDRAMAERNKE